MVARELRRAGRARRRTSIPGVLADGLGRLFGAEADRAPARRRPPTAVLRRFAVVAGGPGTGKTTTVARIVALLTSRPPRPARRCRWSRWRRRPARRRRGWRRRCTTRRRGSTSTTSVRDQLLEPAGHDAAPAARLAARAATAAFATTARNRLPHDVVIVDETSMVSLSLMARLLEAVRPDARLVLVGDPGQLASIEAGAVLGDIVGPRLTRTAADAGARRSGDAGSSCSSRGPPLRRRDRRAGRGDPRAATPTPCSSCCAPDADDVGWHRRRRGRARTPRRSAAVRDARAWPRPGDVVDGRPRRRRRGRAGRARRVPAAVRPPARPDGVATWTAAIEGWLAAALERLRPPASAGTSAGRCSSPRTTTSCGSTTATPA